MIAYVCVSILLAHAWLSGPLPEPIPVKTTVLVIVNLLFSSFGVITGSITVYRLLKESRKKVSLSDNEAVERLYTD